MKKVYVLLLTVIISASAFAQAPEKMSYQAVIRDANNALVTNQAVGMQISILQGSISGTAVYVETQNPTSNLNGLVTFEIGSGTVVSGMFNTIDWSDGPYFIKNETDPTGGTTYDIVGTTQLLSVPYALHSKTAENFSGMISDNQITSPEDSMILISNASGDATWQNPVSDWSDLTLLNGWVDYAGFATPQYARDNDGVVHVKGVISSGTFANGTVLFTLPVNHRPTERRIIQVNNNSVWERIDVYPNGEVISHSLSSNGWLSIDFTFKP